MRNAKAALVKSATARLREVERALSRLMREVNQLTGERDELLAIRKRYGHGSIRRDPAHVVRLARTAGSSGDASGTNKLPSPTRAVMALLDKEPGLKVGDVVERLEGKIQTKSENERRLIASVIDVLVRRTKRLRKDDEGRLYPVAA